jgi:hypothetical protein
LVNLHGCLNNLENTLFGQGRRKNDWYVVERCYTLLNKFGIIINRFIVLFNQIPLVNHQHNAFPIADNKAENIHILPF